MSANASAMAFLAIEFVSVVLANATGWVTQKSAFLPESKRFIVQAATVGPSTHIAREIVVLAFACTAALLTSPRKFVVWA